MAGADEHLRIVIDNGSGTTKAGFASVHTPCSVFPSIVGRHIIHCIMVGMSSKEVYVGYEAADKPGLLALRYPIENGITTDWDNMEQLWHHTFNELCVAPEECTVLLTEQPFNPLANREKTTQIMFETFNTPSVYLSLTPELAAFASGRISGMVIDSGYGVTHIVPVFKGHAIRCAIQKMNIAGHDLTDFMTKLLCESGYSFSNRTIDRRLANDIKEKLCYVQQDYTFDTKDQNGGLEVKYELPDGQIITISSERFRCPESLFQPSLLGLSSAGIQDLVHGSIMKCDSEIHGKMFSNVILSGGNTMFQGMRERIQREVSNRAAAKTRVTVLSDPDRTYSSWRGGCVLASMDNFESMCISKEEYEENGPSIVNKKLF